MIKSFLKSSSFFVLLLFTLITIPAQEKKRSYEFVNQNIDEIIYALSISEGITIVCDHTVTGKGSFRYSGTDFIQAFDTFLESNRLYVNKNETVWTVSKVRIEETGNNLYAIDCYDTTPSVLFEKLSLKGGIPVVFDVLPVSPISVHFKNVTILEAVELSLMGLGLYAVDNKNTYISVTRRNSAPVYSESSSGIADFVLINDNPQMFQASVRKASSSKIFDSLFLCAGKQYINFSKKDILLEKTDIYDKSLDDLLYLLCIQLECTFVNTNGFYYILPSQDTAAAIRNTGKEWSLFSLKYNTAQEVLPLLAARFPAISTITSTPYSFFALCDEKMKAEMADFIGNTDKEKKIKIVSLQYIKAADFLKNLPPIIQAADFKETGDDTKLFFTGTEENYAVLLDQLAVIDAPVKRITYDLLIIQYQESGTSSWTPSLKVRPVELGDALLASAEVGSVMDLQFNVITSFGLTFAAKLNTALTESKAKIFADTTLHGVSGSNIKFQNTSTYRYRDTAVDPDTGKPVYTGVTREIVSGLMLDIEGWVSGDGMVTTKVSASVSKRGADVSNSIGNPPPTYEKVITTQVRSRSGEPVVLSGLVQDDSVLVQERMPLLSKIPLIGYLFTSQSKTNEKTEMVIYLIPHLEEENTGTKQKTIDLEGKDISIKRNEAIYHKYITAEDCNE